MKVTSITGRVLKASVRSAVPRQAGLTVRKMIGRWINGVLVIQETQEKANRQ